MEHKTVIIFGSSRSHGNTRKVLDTLVKLKSNIDTIDLNDYDIGYFDYEFKNKDDDFFELIEKVITYDSIIFATPIYWYTMSAQLKTFFDRMSDLLFEGNKETGRKLRGKQMGVISCGSDSYFNESFEMPFKESASYLGMTYVGHLHTWLNEDSSLGNNVSNGLILFSEKLSN
jgi:multimeric flavodoxin WrbA